MRSDSRAHECAVSGRQPFYDASVRELRTYTSAHIWESDETARDERQWEKTILGRFHAWVVLERRIETYKSPRRECRED